MRKGFEGLYGLVRDRLQCSPLSGHVFLFCNAERNRLKLLVWDGSGLCRKIRQSEGFEKVLSSAKECQKRLTGASRTESMLRDVHPDIPIYEQAKAEYTKIQ